MNSLPVQDLGPLKARIEMALSRGAHPIAAFDADGTLWTNDMGEKLFHYQIENRLLPMLPQDPWDVYMKMQIDESKPIAYLWLAQINNGLPVEQVREWATASVGPIDEIPVIPSQVELIQFLKAQGVETFIVTASVAWAVEPAARAYDIPPENVIGIRTKIVNGRITRDQEGPITYREGKVEALNERTQGRKPVFSSGNTEGDLFLLEYASDSQLVVATAQSHESNFATERRMIKLAKDKGWFFHDYVMEEFK